MTAAAPVVVLGTQYSGTEPVRLLLDGLPDLACTSGTGILPLCEQAAAVWRNADGRPAGQLSRLAVASTRALTDSIMISMLGRTGKRRWCEFSYALPEIAETFALLYPGTRFVCLYRCCGDVIRAALDASPWGLADPSFTPFTRTHPTSAAALAAYWIAHTSSLLAFEAAHPQAVLRIRYEDLTGSGAAAQQTASAVMDFLGIASSGGETGPVLDSQDKPAAALPPAKADLPAGLIPPTLLEQTNNLLKQLGYPVLPDSSRRR